MIQGLCAAYQATGTPAHFAAARRAASVIQDKLTMPDGGVYRAWTDGAAKVPGFLEDYVFLANALIDLYESCFDKRYLDRAVELVALILDKSREDGLYFTPRDGERLVHRPRAPHDSAWPSGISTSVFAFLRFHALTGLDLYRDVAEHEFDRYRAAAAAAPAGFAHLLAARDFAQRGPFEIILAGDKAAAAALFKYRGHCETNDAPDAHLDSSNRNGGGVCRRPRRRRFCGTAGRDGQGIRSADG
jgi:uncharacterized protein YyaL (SSP411 family)